MAKGYGQYCPVALATETLGERWTLLVVLALFDGVTRFSDIQRALPRISPSVLAQRLRSLEHSGIVSRDAESSRTPQYQLTRAGRDLEPLIMNLAVWGQRWARDMEVDDLDPLHLAWSIHLRMNTDAMPDGRTVVEFSFSGVPTDCKRFWIVNNGGQIDMCVEHPGHDVDVAVTANLRRFIEAWRGFRDLKDEIKRGKIQLQGPRDLVRAFPNWLLLSSVAKVKRQFPGRERAAR